VLALHPSITLVKWRSSLASPCSITVSLNTHSFVQIHAGVKVLPSCRYNSLVWLGTKCVLKYSNMSLTMISVNISISVLQIYVNSSYFTWCDCLGESISEKKNKFSSTSTSIIVDIQRRSENLFMWDCPLYKYYYHFHYHYHNQSRCHLQCLSVKGVIRLGCWNGLIS